MTVAIMKTRAELALSQSFETLAPTLPGSRPVAEARARAIGSFAALGLPHRRVEEWKYTDLRVAQSDAHPPALRGAAVDAGRLTAALGALAAIEAHRVVLVDGHLRGELSALPAIPGLTVRALADALADPAFAPAVARTADLEATESVVALNTALMSDGAVVEIAASLDLPVLILHLVTAEVPSAVVTRNIVSVAEGAAVTVIEAHVALGASAVQSNMLTQVGAGRAAKLTHVKVQQEGAGSTHISTWLANVAATADYRAIQVATGAQLARSQLFVDFTGEHATFDLASIALCKGRQHSDITLVVDHAVPHCTSRELHKCVLADTARGVFQGKVIVRPQAQKTDGKMMAQALMLSPRSEFDSKPELEIYADDVVCGHGSTTAEIDAELLFYCRSRGIPEREAKALLVEAFMLEAIDRVEHEGLRAALTDIARDWLQSA